MKEKKSYTCPNATCKKTFTSPLKTLNLQDNPSEPYYACPVCLARVESAEQVKFEKAPTQPALVEVAPKQSAKASEKPAGCQYHLGYLSTRGQKEFPENCLTCMDIVTCMLNKIQLDQ